MSKEEMQLMWEWLKDNPDKKVPYDIHDKELSGLFPDRSSHQIYRMWYSVRKKKKLKEPPYINIKDFWKQDEINKLQQWINNNPSTDVTNNKLPRSLLMLFPDRSSHSIYAKLRRIKLLNKTDNNNLWPQEKEETKLNLLEIINNAVNSYIDQVINLKMKSLTVENNDALQGKIAKQGCRINFLEAFIANKLGLSIPQGE